MATTDGTLIGDLVEVAVEAVRSPGEVQTTASFLEMKEVRGDRRLPVFIGPQEASAIAFAMQGRSSPRPMTHDALKQAVDALDGQVVRIVLGHRPETSTYTADVTVALDGGEERRFDWRVSDAVALAVRCDPPPVILVPAPLLDPPPGRGPAAVTPDQPAPGPVLEPEPPVTAT
jgi:bifunctional DNase/RNase